MMIVSEICQVEAEFRISGTKCDKLLYFTENGWCWRQRLPYSVGVFIFLLPCQP